eukprot:504668-Amphidinium_carterae.2
MTLRVHMCDMSVMCRPSAPKSCRGRQVQGGAGAHTPRCRCKCLTFRYKYLPSSLMHAGVRNRLPASAADAVGQRQFQ